MKKFTLFAISVFTVSVAQAQIGKGSLLLGGRFNFGVSDRITYSPDNKSKSEGAHVSPAFGTAVKENLIAGAGFSYGKSKSNTKYINNAEQRYENENKGVFIFIRKYRALGKGFYLFGEPSIYYRHFTAQFTTTPNLNENNSYEKQQSVGLSFYPSVSYAVNKKFHLEVGMNEIIGLDFTRYHYQQQRPNATSTTSIDESFVFRTNINSNSPFTVGARIVLAK